MRDQDARKTDQLEQTDGDYSWEEIKTNRGWNLYFTGASVILVWVMVSLERLPLGGAVVLSLIIVICSWLYRVLFASNTASKLGDDFVGSGKRVGPITMGTILGYLNDGFKR
jgi:hypothetical protein